MADPATIMAGVGMAASAAGAVSGAFGASSSGASSAQMYQYQAGVARLNQDIAKQNAAWTRAAGEVSAQRYGMKARTERGEIRTSQAARGLDVSSGSNAAVQDSHAEIAQHDMATIRSNAAHRAYGFDVKAMEDEVQSNIFEMSSSKAKTAGSLGVASSIIGGASSVASKWMQYKTMFGSTEPSYDFTGSDEPGGP